MSRIEPQRSQISAGAIELAALDYGSPPNPAGPPVVLLHGSTDLAWSMDSVAQALCGRHRVIAMDLRGHGDSPHPGAYSPLHYLADVTAALDTLALDRPILVGHSLGGHTASQYAALHPEVPAAVVLLEGLGPPAVHPGTDPHSSDNTTRALLSMLSSPANHRPYADTDAAAERLQKVHPGLSAERAALLALHGTRPGPDGGVIWRFDPRVRDWVAGMDIEATERRWALVTCPVLALTAADAWDRYWTVRLSPLSGGQARERLTPKAYADRISVIADLEHHFVDDAGHMIHFDQPDRVNELVLDFLDRQPKAPPR